MKQFALAIAIAAFALPGFGCAKKQKANVMLTETAEQTTTPTHMATVSNKTETQDAEGAGRRPIFFEFNSSELTESSRQELSRLAAELARDGALSVTIEGNTDSRGTTEYNLALGERRARAAKDYLARLGVESKRIGVVSYGEERPAARGETEEAFARNRRDEFVLNN